MNTSKPASADPTTAISFWREPLLHFLLLGAALFALGAWQDQYAAPQGRIVLDEARVRALAENFRRTWQRPPTAGEIDGLIEEQIRDEVLTREAQRLGLDRDDTVIRRRLRQKIEIITEEAAAVTPTEAQLQAYLDTHGEVFRRAPRVAFAQVFLDPGKRGNRLDSDIKTLLAQLKASNRRSANADFSRLGDQIFVLKSRYPLSDSREIAASFGADFAAALTELPRGEWRGPVASGYGLHLVRVDELVSAPMPSLADVRALVEREWRNEQRKAVAQAQYQRLRAGYQIVVKRPGEPR